MDQKRPLVCLYILGTLILSTVAVSKYCEKHPDHPKCEKWKSTTSSPTTLEVSSPTPSPSPSPSPSPTPSPSPSPSPSPTPSPSPSTTSKPTSKITPKPTPSTTSKPTQRPTSKPTPTPKPTAPPELPESVDLETICNIECSNPPQEEALAAEVCGITADGERRGFKNMCAMKKYGCEFNKKFKEIDIRFCDEPYCLRSDPPVCAHFGSRKYVSFENACSADLFSCQFPQKYHLVSYKKCKSNPPKCSKDLCVDQFLPVCGVNSGKSYHLFPNECQMKKHNCQFQEAYRETSIDLCKRQLCESPCPALDEPVCGRNEKNETKFFANECILDNYNCKKDNQYEPVPLKSCQKNCPTEACDSASTAICASNNVEFKSFKCKREMLTYNCEKGKEFKVVPDSNCNCPTGNCVANAPKVCATTGNNVQWYNNLCDLRNVAQCGFLKYILPINQQFCESKPTCPTDDSVCLNQYYPVCAVGRNKLYKIYNSPCSVWMVNCRDKLGATIVDSNYCKDTVVSDKCRSLTCDYRYEPVCGRGGSAGVTNHFGLILTDEQPQLFGNACSLRFYNCVFDADYQVTDFSECSNVTYTVNT